MSAAPFQIGTRVFHKPIKPRGSPEHGGWYGTVVRMPDGAEGVPPDLVTVLRDDGSLYAIALDGLELQDCGGEDGLQISIQRLQAKREALFEEMVRAVASCQRVELADPTARRRIEGLVKGLGASWSDAEGAKLRRKVFLNTELRRLLTRYLELADLMKELGELVEVTG